MPPRPDEPTVERTLERLYAAGWPKPTEYSDVTGICANYYEALKIVAAEAIMEQRDFALEKLGPKIGIAIKNLGYEMALWTFDLVDDYVGDLPPVQAA